MLSFDLGVTGATFFSSTHSPQVGRCVGARRLSGMARVALLLATVLMVARKAQGNYCTHQLGGWDPAGSVLSFMHGQAGLCYDHFHPLLCDRYSDLDVDLSPELYLRVASNGNGAHVDLGTWRDIADRYPNVTFNVGVFLTIHFVGENLVIENGPGHFQELHPEDVEGLKGKDGVFAPQEGHVYLLNGTFDDGWGNKVSRITKLVTTNVQPASVHLTWEILRDGADPKGEATCHITLDGQGGPAKSGSGGRGGDKGSSAPTAIAYVALAVGLVSVTAVGVLAFLRVRRSYEMLP